MLAVFIFVFTIMTSLKYNKFRHFLFYNLIIFTLIFFLGVKSYTIVDDINFKPSDTSLYYNTFMMNFDDASSQLFSKYPVLLKYICFPFNYGFLALIAQANITFLLIMLIVKEKSNIIFFMIYFNHALIYTNINFLKDNFLIMTVLLVIFVLKNINNKIIQAILIFFSMTYMAEVRPFYRFFSFLAVLPFFNHEFFKKSKKAVIFTYLFLISAAGGVFFLYRKTIFKVLSSWNDTASVGTEGFSMLSPVKIIFGPTPLRYLDASNTFVQPFLPEHQVPFFILHVLYYLILPVIIILFFLNLKKFLFFTRLKISSLYSFFLSLGTFTVYLVTYGSADIRQRAIILLFLSIFVFEENTFELREVLKYKYVYAFFILLEAAITVMA